MELANFGSYLSILCCIIVPVTGQEYYINLYTQHPDEGTIELSDGLSWFVLHPQGWTDRNAEVTCRMLGYQGDGARTMFGSTLPTVSRSIWVFQFSCHGNETSLSECNTDRLSSTAGHTTVGVKCSSSPAPPEYDFFLRETRNNKLSKTNIDTMSGIVDMNTACISAIDGSVVYDSLYDQVIYFKDSSFWGCRWGVGKNLIHAFASGVSIHQFALDKEERLLFYYLDGTISVLNLDSTTASPTVVINTTYAHTMALDPLNKEVYWFITRQQVIERAYYNGTSRGILSAVSSSGAVTSIAFSGDNVFWMDTRVPGIRKRCVNNNSMDDTIFTGIPLCYTLYILGEWVYCMTDTGILRLEKNGKCGGYHGPFLEENQHIIQYDDRPNGVTKPMCERFYINLIGVKPNEGTIELSNGIDWHILCADGWDNNDAAVACRMLGYSGNGSISAVNASSSGQAYSIWPFKFHCNGDEMELSECEASPFYSSECKRAVVQCSEQKVVKDFFIKRTMKGLSKTNPFTMSGYINLANPCNFITGDVMYDAVNDQFIYFQSGSLWGCRRGDRQIEIRTNISTLKYPALDSEDRLLFGYLNSTIVSLRVDDMSADFRAVVSDTSVGMKLVLDTERNEIYWWRPYYHNIIKRVGYDGNSMVDILKTSSYFKMFTFNGDSIFAIDSRWAGIVKVHRNTTVQEHLYEQHGIMDDSVCTEMYTDKEWIYCVQARSVGILRLQADGKGGRFHGPLEYSRSAFTADILYHYNKVSPDGGVPCIKNC